MLPAHKREDTFVIHFYCAYLQGEWDSFSVIVYTYGIIFSLQYVVSRYWFVMVTVMIQQTLKSVHLMEEIAAVVT